MAITQANATPTSARHTSKTTTGALASMVGTAPLNGAANASTVIFH